MEPEVHIIERHFQEILHCLTMTNIRCRGEKEIDLLRMNPLTAQKFHIEARISTSHGFVIGEKDTCTPKVLSLKLALNMLLPFQKA